MNISKKSCQKLGILDHENIDYTKFNSNDLLVFEILILNISMQISRPPVW